MFSRWEKVSGAIMDGPTLGTRPDAASGKSVNAGRKKAARENGRPEGAEGVSGEGPAEPLLVIFA